MRTTAALLHDQSSTDESLLVEDWTIPREQQLGASILSLRSALRTPPASATMCRPQAGAGGWNATSLFSGCGGMDLGFAFGGIESTIAIDSSAAAVAAFNANHRPAAISADLSCGLQPLGRADVLLAGAPCQGFSTNGRRDVNDSRNGLLRAIDAACTQVRPRVIVVENVPAALSGAHSSHWRRLEAALFSLGYNVRSLLLDAAKHGAAQSRKRLFLLAWRGSDCIRLEVPQKEGVTLGSALTEVTMCDDHEPRLLPRDSDAYGIACHIRPGQKLSNVRLGERNVATWEIPEIFGATSQTERDVLVAVTRLRRRKRLRTFGDGDPVPIATLSEEVGLDVSEIVDDLIKRQYLRRKEGGIEHRLTYNGKYRRLNWSGVSPTVDTHFGDPRLFLHPSEHRGMTVREAMRIQGFPDWFRAAGAMSAQFSLVGNAVPPPLGTDVATFVREAILKV